MVEEAKHPETQTVDFDANLIQPTEYDWSIISNSPSIVEPRERCVIIGDLALLDPQRGISSPTEEDWGYFVERTTWLNGRDEVIERNQLVQEMAKVDREKAAMAFNSGELENIWEPALRSVLRGGKDVGFFAYVQELLIYTDPERAKRVFDEFGEVAWNSERRYLSWLRHESPAQFFTLLAALSEMFQDQTLLLLEKSDWRLAQEGLIYYRGVASENRYQIEPLVRHLAALKKLTPLFEQLFRQESS